MMIKCDSRGARASGTVRSALPSLDTPVVSEALYLEFMAGTR